MKVRFHWSFIADVVSYIMYLKNNENISNFEFYVLYQIELRAGQESSGISGFN